VSLHQLSSNLRVQASNLLGKNAGGSFSAQEEINWGLKDLKAAQTVTKPLMGATSFEQLFSPLETSPAVEIDEWFANISSAQMLPTREKAEPDRTLDQQLFDRKADFKVFYSQIAMHLTDDIRKRLFRQIDSLLDKEEWDERDLPPTLASFRTFIRLMLLLRPDRRPGLGADHQGHLLGFWAGDDQANRLTIEFLANDRLRWSLSRTFDSRQEHAAGDTQINRLQAVLSPYSPQIWFGNAE
jgi:hypothetical protein